jgi:hypothetical protein
LFETRPRKREIHPISHMPFAMRRHYWPGSHRKPLIVYI